MKSIPNKHNILPVFVLLWWSCKVLFNIFIKRFLSSVQYDGQEFVHQFQISVYSAFWQYLVCALMCHTFGLIQFGSTQPMHIHAVNDDIIKRKTNHSNSAAFWSLATPMCICDLFGVIGLNLSLLHSTISCTHLIKAIEPLIQAIISLFIFKNNEKIKYLFESYTSIIIICIGVMLVTIQNTEFLDWSWIIFALFATIGTQIRISIAKQLTTSVKGSVLTILGMMATINSLLLFITNIILHLFFDINTNHDDQTILISSYTVCYAMYQFASFNVLKRVSSSIIHSIGNVWSRILVIIVSSIINGDLYSFKWYNICGIVITFIGSFAFKFSKSDYYVQHKHNIIDDLKKNFNSPRSMCHMYGLLSIILVTTIQFSFLTNYNQTAMSLTTMPPMFTQLTVTHTDCNDDKLKKGYVSNTSNVNDLLLYDSCVHDISNHILHLIEKFDINMNNILNNRDEYCISYGEFPNYNNHGDTLMTLGELEFFRYFNIYPDSFVFINRENYQMPCVEYKKENQLQNNKTIKIYHFFHGGGNFNNLYKSMNDWRVSLIEKNNDYVDKWVIFPQSVYIDLDENKLYHSRYKQRFNEMVKFWGNGKLNSKVYFMARSFESIKYLKMLKFNLTNVVLAPDIAFMDGIYNKYVNDPIYDIIVISRRDKEKTASDMPQHQSHGYINVNLTLKNGNNGNTGNGSNSENIKYSALQQKTRKISYYTTDWVYHRKYYFYHQFEDQLFAKFDQLPNMNNYEMSSMLEVMTTSKINEMMATLTKGKIVISDRFHGAIAAIMNRKKLIYLSELTNKIEQQLQIIQNISTHCKVLIESNVKKAQNFQEASQMAVHWLL